VAAPRLRNDGIPFGSYLLIKRVARGGMAEVFLARQQGVEGFEREVALKRILPHLVESKEFVDMFVEEARVAARLRHPNIAHIYDFGKVEDSPFIAMEFVEGVDGAKLLDEASRSAIPVEHAARIAADVCAGLHHAHALKGPDGRPLGLVHRDVSPQNVLIGFDGQVKLVDFGIAKAAARVQRTRPGVVRGKFAYMSPEQCQGRELDGRSDVFNLGIVLWEWLAGTTAFHRDDPVEAGRDITQGRLPALREKRPDVPPALEAIVRRALEVDRDRRYATASAMQLELEAFLRDARMPSNAILLGQFVRTRFRGDKSEVRGAPLGSTPRAPAGTQVVAAEPPATQPAEPPWHDAETALLDNAKTVRVPTPVRPVPKTRTAPAGTALVQKAPPRRSRAPWLAAALLLVAGAAAFYWWRTREQSSATPPAPPLLEVRSDPAGAHAVIDGTPIAEVTPFTLRSLGPGTHTIGLTLPGYNPITRAIDLAAGESRTLDLSFSPTAPIVTRPIPPVPEPVPVPVPTTRAATPSRPTQPSRSTPRPDRAVGTLSVAAVPYAEVYLGRRHLGTTPIAELELAVGTYTLKLVHPGKPPVLQRVTIASGQLTKLRVNLR